MKKNWHKYFTICLFTFQGLFHQVIAQSGSAIAPWAFDDNISHEGHTRNIAAMVNCNLPDAEDLVNCMKSVPASNITSAANSYSVSSFYIYIRIWKKVYTYYFFKCIIVANK